MIGEPLGQLSLDARGLLYALGIRSPGKIDLSSDLTATIDLLPMLGLRGNLDPIQTTGLIGAGAAGNVTLTVPNDEIWIVNQVGLTIPASGPATTGHLFARLQPQTIDVGLTPLIAGQATTFVVGGLLLPRVLLMQSGDSLTGTFLNSSAGGLTFTVSCTRFIVPF